MKKAFSRVKGNLLQNDDEAEVKHLTRLLNAKGPQTQRVVTWTGGWLCPCGRVCWPRQHCKACGQSSPCRDWCFEGGCNKVNCKFPHPSFYLPARQPAAGADGLAVDGRELIKLPPPGSVPATDRARLAKEQKLREQAAQTAAAKEIAANSAQPKKQAGANGYAVATVATGDAAAIAGCPTGIEASWPAAALDGSSAEAGSGMAGRGGGAASGDDSVWADLVARARAAQAAAVGGSQGTAAAGSAGAASRSLAAEDSTLELAGSVVEVAGLGLTVGTGSPAVAQQRLAAHAGVPWPGPPAQAEAPPQAWQTWQGTPGFGSVDWGSVLGGGTGVEAAQGWQGAQHPVLAAPRSLAAPLQQQEPQDSDLEHMLSLLCAT